MPMPYQVVGKGPYQVQGKSKGKWVNGKDMSYDTLAEAWRKVTELIEADYIRRVPEDVRKEIAKKVIKDYNEQGNK
jgi:hypothetical protein